MEPVQESLMQMGFSAQEAARALQATNGQLAPALDFLLGKNTSAPASQISSDRIQELTEMGFSREEATQALEKSSGSLSQALDFLFHKGSNPTKAPPSPSFKNQDTSKARVILIASTIPERELGQASFDPSANEASLLIEQAENIFKNVWNLEVIKIIDGTPLALDSILQNIPGYNNVVYLWWVGHGGHDRDDSRLIQRTLGNGLVVHDHPHFPEDSPNWWMRFPKSDSNGNRLYVEDLKLQLTKLCSSQNNFPPKLKCVSIFLGACFSAGMAESWIPNSNLPILLISSADEIGRVGTWSWHEILRYLKSPAIGNQTFFSLFNRMKDSNPVITYSNAEARGEPTDSFLCQLFCGNNQIFENLKLKDFFGSKPTLSQMQIVSYMDNFPMTSVLSPGQEVRDLSLVKAGNSELLINDLLTHGFALLDIGEKDYNEIVHPMWNDLETFMNLPDEIKFKSFAVSVGPNQEDCGYALDPGNMEQFKFLNSGLCKNNKDEKYPWPENPPSFRNHVLQYYEFSYSLAKYISTLLVLHIGPENGGKLEEWEKLYDPKEMSEDFFSNGDCRFFRYIGNSTMSSEKFVGEIHVDIGMISVGPLSQIPGIQFFDRKDLVWRVPESSEELKGKNIFAVWIGDILRCLSGGHLKGTIHRVKLDAESKNRFSMPFFIRARNDVPIRTLNENVKDEEKEYFNNYTIYFEKKFKTTQCTADFAYLPPF